MKRIAMLTMVLAVAAWAGTAAADCGHCGKDAKAETAGTKHMDGMEHAAHHEMMDNMQEQQLVQHYAAMASALAEDSTAGVAGHAMAMAKALTPSGSDDPMVAAQSLATLQQKNLGIDKAREAFKSLSADLVPMLEEHYPAAATADTKWVVYHCDMAPGSWVQAEGKAMNPYYGSKMLHCGKQVAVLGSDDDAKSMDGSMDHDSMGKGSMDHGSK